VTELGEIPARPVEKFRASEATREPDRTSIFRWLRDRGLLIYITAALSAATPFKHERMEAAEIPPGATWMEGVETLRNGVFSDKVETQGTFYIENQTHRGKWIFGKEGELASVPYIGTDIEGPVERELSSHPTQDITVCGLHTHPLRAGEAMGWLSAEESRNVREGKHSISIPPSGSGAEVNGDISLWLTGIIESTLKKLRQKEVRVEARQGVVDAAGITYYRPIKDEDLKQEYPGIIAEVEHKRAVLREWEEAINHAVDNLDAATVNKLHGVIPMDSERYQRLYTGSYSVLEEQEFERGDIKEALISGSWIDAIAPVLFEGNPKGQKLQHAFKKEVLDKRRSDMGILYEARVAFGIISKTIAPEQLTSTPEYTKLREAYALNGSKIRFVPHTQVPNEPPCAGTD
jgi:hypothetical protein